MTKPTRITSMLRLIAWTLCSAWMLVAPSSVVSAAEEVLVYHYVIFPLDDQTSNLPVLRGKLGEQSIILAPKTEYGLWLLQPETRLVAYFQFVTPEAGQRYQIPTLLREPIQPLDADGDGLEDLAEFILGTDPNNPDTDGDGVRDGAEVDQSNNPLDGLPVIPGIIASSDTPGTAVDVCAINDIAIVADSAAGVIIFNVAGGQNPVRIAQVDTPGLAVRVACSGNLVAVADSGSGLAVVDISDPPGARIVHQVVLGSPAQAVTAAGGIAYVGLANGQVVAVDLLSGNVVQRLSVGSAIHDLGIEGDRLFVLTATELVASPLADAGMSILGRINGLSYIPEGITGSRRLFVGGGIAYVTSYPGFDTISVVDPRAMSFLGTARDGGPNSFKQIVANGSGLGVAAVGINPRDDGTHDLSLYNIANAAVTTSFLTTLVTPGVARAVSIYNGLAYVADSEAGLQVINYLPADTRRFPPTISLTASFPFNPPAVEETKRARVTANVADDVQVRNVEFYIDGVRVAIDGNYPFEFHFVTPERGARDSFRVRLRAIDTGGNATFTDELTVALLPDQTPPMLTRTIPAADAIAGSVKTVAAFFNEPLNAASVRSITFKLRWFGPDEIADTSDDIAIRTGTVSYKEELNAVFMTFTNDLPPGVYGAALLPPLQDQRGNALFSRFVWIFRVIEGGADTDQDGVPDALELTLGLDPNNSDTDSDGLNDGSEDFDNDGLVNVAEVFLGTSPTNPDTDGNGIRDGDEDSDGDSLKNSVEIAAGTNPRRADSDADGWPDETELTTGANPHDRRSRPQVATIAQPPLKVIAPAPGITGGLGLNTVVASPPLKVTAPALGNTDGLAFNSVIANPPVRVTAPALGIADGLGFNSVVAQPPVKVTAPAVGATGGLTLNTSVAQPPVEVRFE